MTQKPTPPSDAARERMATHEFNRYHVDRQAYEQARMEQGPIGPPARDTVIVNGQVIDYRSKS